MNEDTYHQPKEDEINLIDILVVLLKWKKLIIGITIGSTVIAIIASLLMTPIFKAETKILPPQQGGSGAASHLLSQMAGGAAGIAGGILGMSSPNEVYVQMLKSRTIFDRMIKRFNLEVEYKAKTSEGARAALNNNIVVASDKKSNVISVEVLDKSPQKAAEMANAFVEELKNMTKKLAVSEASQRRLFFEEQLKEAKVSLIKAEEDMRGFQEKSGALQVDEQARVVIEGMAQLRAQIAAKEVQAQVMKGFATTMNPDYQRLHDELAGMKSELKKLEAKSTDGSDMLFSTGRMPAVGTEYVRRLRELKFNEALYEIMIKQYEMAKLDESRDAMLIQVIDHAVPPEMRAKPRRSMIVILSTMTGFLISVFCALILEYIQSPSGIMARNRMSQKI